MKTVQETLDLFGYHGGDKEHYILEYRISEYYILEPYILEYRILEYILLFISTAVGCAMYSCVVIREADVSKKCSFF